MAKTIVTHQKPHLDEVCAIWLLQRYHPDFKKYRLRFVAQGTPLALGQKKPRPSEILIGTGLGAFDEHTGKMADSAATLVYKFLAKSGLLPKESFKKRAIETIVEHVRATDFAEHHTLPHLVREFLPETIINGWERQHTDAAVIRKGVELLETLYLEHRSWEEMVEVWKKRQEFRIGRFRVAGLVGHPLGGADKLAFDHGFDFIIMVDTRYNRRQFRASSGSRVDFTPVYNMLLAKDPESRWYLHHSGKLLISGSDVAVARRLSRLDLEQLIQISRMVL